ncbi:glutathione S-transferase C-terminal-like protein [Atractiella rhizophila]|nr:glutathione S-transferase C-terminal-like protein [Atractiella rhizophila]
MVDFTLYSHDAGPNPWKVAIVLECLGLDYQHIYMDFKKGEHKGPEHTKLNPNGRVPTLIEHKNNDFTIWESCAIITYLADKYDTERKLSAATPEDKFIELQYLFFQASGQGPYFGQFGWFTFFHPEKITSAQERYKNEINRVWSVLEDILSKKEWLGGSKCTVADLSFITWNEMAINTKAIDDPEKYPKVFEWHKKMVEMPPVKKVLEEKAGRQKH